MSLLHIDSFDHFDRAFVNYDYGPYKCDLTEFGVSSLAHLLGWLGVGKCVQFLDDFSYSGGWSYSIPQSNTVIVGIAHKISHLLTVPWYRSSFIRLRRGSLTQLSLQIDGSGQLVVVRGGSIGDSVVIGTSNRRFPTDTWNYIEFKATIHDSAGSFEVRVDGETVCSGSGVDTQDLTDGGVTTVSIFNNGNGVYKQYFDDLYICNSDGSVNNDFLGAVRIDTLVPDGAGSSTQWAASTGSNFDCVNETIHLTTDTDYVSTYTDNNIDTYNFGTLSFTPSVIRGVQVSAAAQRSSIQDRNLQLVTRVNNTNYTSGTYGLRSSEKVFYHLMETNPNGGSAWTKAVIDSAEFGVKAV